MARNSRYCPMNKKEVHSLKTEWLYGVIHRGDIVFVSENEGDCFKWMQSRKGYFKIVRKRRGKDE